MDIQVLVTSTKVLALGALALFKLNASHALPVTPPPILDSPYPP